MSTRYKHNIRAAGVGAGLGLVLLVGIVLVVRPHSGADEPPMTPSLASPTVVSSPSVTVPLSPTPNPLADRVPESPSPVAAAPETITYTVQEGDSLSQIALDLGTTVREIVAVNDVTPDMIFAGQVLTIPRTAVDLPTPSPPAAGEDVIHIVVAGDTLSGLARAYALSIDAIMSANQLTSDAIQVGQQLIIPVTGDLASRPTPAPVSEAWEPSVLQGDLAVAYPLNRASDRFTLHYQPESLPAREIDTIMARVHQALDHIESILEVDLQGRFDAYVAGSLFGAPNLALRGRSFSSQRRFFFLHDGTGTPADQQYILTHELTHLTTWNTMGNPVSVMLHEGVAVYAGMKLVDGDGHVTIETFCAAYQEIGRLPRIAGAPSFRGHIRDLDTYYAAGCFVQYLIETYGPSAFADVYHTGDYHGNYGKGLGELEAEWLAALASSGITFSFAPERLASCVARVAAGYDRLFASFRGTSGEMEAYRELDRARMAVLYGRLDEADMHLTSFDELLGGEE